MRAKISTQLRDFWDAGIRGPDFVWAATGPAMEAYSKHPVVRKALIDGEVMSVGEFLTHVRRMVVDYVVGQVLTGANEKETVTADRLDEVTAYYLLHRYDFRMEEAPIGACILYATACGISDIEDAGVKWEMPNDQISQDSFFVDEVPDLIEQAAFLSLDQGLEVQWDAIVMDEAQDFHARWWEVLQCTLLKGSDEGIFYAFADPIQRLWDWAPTCPPVEFQTKYTLKRNCRNSRWICRTSTTIGQTEAAYFRRSPIGDRPAVNNVPSMPAMKGILIRTVEELLKHHDLKPSNIVLIGPSSYEKGSLAEVSEIAGVPLTNIFNRWHEGKGILVTTAKSFKGLEADVVIMYDLVGFSSVFTRVDLYVACTRARSHIHFLVVGREMLEEIRHAVLSAESELGKAVV